MTDGLRLDAARRLRALALEFTERSRLAQADLVRAFEAAAAAISPQVGDVVVEDDDDESLTLTAGGRFRGSVRDADTVEWRALEASADVVDFYDPVDLFDDLAGAIEDAFPELADEADEMPSAPSAAPTDRPAPSIDPWLNRMPRPDAAQADGAPLETASLTILRDLHAAGVFSDEEFARRKAELDRR
ncbi:MAG TPA: SHOCT domain-containing protein [Candidatus Limnocylindrales bacterium]